MLIKNYTTKIDVFESLGEIQGALAKNIALYKSNLNAHINFEIKAGDNL